MSEPESGLPRYPEIAARAERESNRVHDDGPGSFRDWLRHTWGQLVIVGVVGIAWLLGLIGILLLANGTWDAIGLYLLVSAGVVGQGMRAGRIGGSLWRRRSDQ